MNLACGTANPTPYAEWPDPTTGDAVLKLARAALTRGGARLRRRRQRRTETLIDDAGVTADDADERGGARTRACST